MEYFMMQQDQRLKHLPGIRLPEGFLDREQRKDEITPLTFYVESSGLTCQYADYLLQPFHMIGERIQKVMEKYQREISFRRVILMDKKTGLQHNYYRIFVPEIDGAFAEEPDCGRKSEGTEPVLNPDRIKDAKIFQVKQFHENLFVRLDVAESILRREPEGIWFTPVALRAGKAV